MIGANIGYVIEVLLGVGLLAGLGAGGVAAYVTRDKR